MKTKEEKTNLIGLEELNESVKKEVSGGSPFIDGGCCGLVILRDPDDIFLPKQWDPWKMVKLM